KSGNRVSIQKRREWKHGIVEWWNYEAPLTPYPPPSERARWVLSASARRAFRGNYVRSRNSDVVACRFERGIKPIRSSHYENVEIVISHRNRGVVRQRRCRVRTNTAQSWIAPICRRKYHRHCGRCLCGAIQR